MTEQSTREPAEIRRDIEATRGELGDTVEALARKADVKAQARQKLAAVKGAVAANPVPLAVAGAAVVGLILVRIVRR
jgi:hypothetical protein